MSSNYFYRFFIYPIINLERPFGLIKSWRASFTLRGKRGVYSIILLILYKRSKDVGSAKFII